DRVVVKDGSGQRQVESGQYLLAFEGDPAEGSLSVIERKLAPAAVTEDWFGRGLALEPDDPMGAAAAYRKALEADPSRVDARINLGRLLHELGKLKDAE